MNEATIKKGDEITVGYQVSETRQMRLSFRQDWAGWTPEKVVQLLNDGELVARGVAGEASVITLPVGDVVVADIQSDEPVDGGTATLFSLEDVEQARGQLQAGAHCPGVGCGGRLGQTTEDGLTCPECGQIWNYDATAEDSDEDLLGQHWGKNT